MRLCHGFTEQQENSNVQSQSNVLIAALRCVLALHGEASLLSEMLFQSADDLVSGSSLAKPTSLSAILCVSPV